MEEKKVVSGDSPENKTSPKSSPVPQKQGVEEVKRIKSFKRINADKQLGKEQYFVCLVPEANRGNITVGSMCFPVFTQVGKKQRSGGIRMVDEIGSVVNLTKENYERTLKATYKTGLRLRGRKQSPQKFKIQAQNPSDHYWEESEYPIGQWLVLEKVSYLKKKYGESWRSLDSKIETLIPRDGSMTDGWNYEEPVKPDIDKDMLGDFVF